ncbi:NADP oxidoreductase coenzyme F420-dependent [Emticicia oligotrophica DSM 17448]|uniref:NADP oxidoreductase coenzyme F420-dependent n=1 Tax=Emticicia oligotrophica (strain DSM 17448 / CIP 109782 / MTCC 6937 / GPTSA100-15) TaxID=929562 RepID=A0ABM5N6N6_EMTOG|nr:prephenate dehydrogenase [Emticicia oligotrophica]AFK05001.1 NADP oxidoreductase coenzyme F420-dependent [Emticicia oligotrophica DSM 17448]
MKIGIIGLGDMGKMFAKIWANTGLEVFGCDLPQNREILENELGPFGIKILNDGIAVSRLCDFILYSVEAENIEKVVAQCGPSTKYGAIVAGQTSVKTPEIAAFEKYLPQDAQIVTCHALYGPAVNPVGQTLVVVNHRASITAFEESLKVFHVIGSIIHQLEDFHAHDRMMADIQAVTHIGFESIGTAFMHRKVYPWENTLHPNGLDNVKLLMTLRIYSYKFHVYSGLALQNPYAKRDVRNYAKAENELFEMMIQENEKKFRKRIYSARDSVFKDKSGDLMLDDKIMSEFSLSQDFEHKPNSHLSLLAMVDTWHKLGTNPYKNLICQTPPFKLRVGMAEYLFMNDSLLEETIEAALFDKTIRGEDLAFHTAVHEWANIVEMGDKESYRKHFEATKTYLSDRLEEGRAKSSLLISKLQNA